MTRSARLLDGRLERLAVPSAIVREMDRRTIEDCGIPGAVLMENAGAAAADVALEMLQGKAGTVLVFAGAGNNAGDGFVVARHLANHGLPVRVSLAVAAEKYKGDAALYLSVIRKMGLPIDPWTGAVDTTGVSLLVDALLGTGLSGDLRAPFPDVIRFMNATGIPTLAVDVPSGVDSDTGRTVTAAVEATVTVTFGLPKAGLFSGDGPRLAGCVILADIGMPRSVYPEGKALYT